MFLNICAVALGGAIGAVLRYGSGLVVTTLIPTHHLLTGFPLATLVVNFIGCFAIGFASHFLTQADFLYKDTWKLFCVTGLLGGFTTFSAFSLESLELLQNGNAIVGTLYISTSVVLCLISAAAGRFLAQYIWKS